ncbi:MAG: NAD(P)H-hydrate dehydratase [Ferruginibacter sp.]
MKIFDASQLKEWDAFTMQEQEVTQVDLVYRAAKACFNWLEKEQLLSLPFHIFCGKGNNGADGLALALMLVKNKTDVDISILETGKPGSDAFQFYLHELHLVTSKIHFIQALTPFQEIGSHSIIIDALFGTGLNKPLIERSKEVVEYINSLSNIRIAIDVPSGLFSDKSSTAYAIINAKITLSFQQPKLAFLLAENENYIGELHMLDIGLSKNYDPETELELLDVELVKGILLPRNKFSHKGNYGHAAIAAGSYGMMGAALLAAKACLACGAGKLTCFIPAKGFDIMQTTVPEAMCVAGGEDFIEQVNASDLFTVLGAGPGIGIHEHHARWLKDSFLKHPALVLDADALNIMASDKTLLEKLPPQTVLTPHPKEFEKLFGKPTNDFERIRMAIDAAKKYKIYIVLKGHYSFICTPFGKGYFNSTGNAGMAKGGMGDVLTGVITGLISSGYPLPEAAILGVYIHGLAGDLAAEKYSQQAMQATHLIECVADAWKKLMN